MFHVGATVSKLACYVPNRHEFDPYWVSKLSVRVSGE